MAFEQFWNTLKKRWGLIVICFVVLGLGGFISAKLTTPMYPSETLVQVVISSQNDQANINSLLASDQLVQTEAELATSDPVLREVASHYPGVTVDELTKNVSTAPKVNTQLFAINVLDSSPTRGAAIANDIAATLIKQQTQSTPQGTTQSQQSNIQSQQQVLQDLTQTQKKIETITSQIATLQTTDTTDPRISTLTTQLDALQLHYSQWQSLLDQLKMAGGQGSNFLHIAQSAQPASKPSQPNVPLSTGVGLLVGLLNGLLLALLLEQLDTRVRTQEALTSLVNWPVLATIWGTDSKDKKNKTKDEDLVNPPRHSPNIESYRMLRTNLGFSMLDKRPYSIMVTSAIPNDGKSTVAANLAIFMAKAGKKTLLIDADLRRPTVNKKLHLAATNTGLSNALVACAQLRVTATTPSQWQSNPPLSTNLSLEPFIQAVDIPNLRVIPSGILPPNPPELLDSKGMEHFLSALANSGADVVIFDVPPILGLSDASILASKVDGVIAVVDITSANKKNLKQMGAVLAQPGCNVLGCVVNKQRPNRKDSAYAYYNYYSPSEEGTQDTSMQNQNGYFPAVPSAMGATMTPKPVMSVSKHD